MIDPERERALEQLAQRAVAQDGAALDQLVEKVWPELVAFVRANPSMGPLGGDEDHVRNVATRVIQKLKSRIHLYGRWSEGKEEKTVLDWLRIVSKNAIRDYQRQQLGQRSSSNEPSAKRLLNEFASSERLEEFGVRPSFTAAETARELMEFARLHLSTPQWSVLGRWLEGATFDEMGAELGVPGASTRLTLQAGIAVLRRHFRQ